jgi:dihydroorotase
VARRLLDQGFPPDTISTDLSATSFTDLRPGLLTVINKWLALGLPLVDALRASTSAPAAAIGRGDLGSLGVGGPADLAILHIVEEPVEYRDALGQVLPAERRLVPRATVLDGEVAWIAEPQTPTNHNRD